MDTDGETHSAHDELLEYLKEGESIEAVSFGPWGYDSADPDPQHIPKELRGIPMTWARAQDFMREWSFYSGFGAPKTYAAYIWTNMRVIWVHEYDGSTRLASVPRDPKDEMPALDGIEDSDEAGE